MDFQTLDKDRFLRKAPSQDDRTKGAVFPALNPVPKRGDNDKRKRGIPDDSEEDDGAPNILTGTVIIACFIQTSALPSRIEMQGNDLTFFDDTVMRNGQVSGDTSRLIFTHGSGKKGGTITSGFILEKRASVYNTYDNVLSLYSPQPPIGAHNYIFIGRNGSQVNGLGINDVTPYLTSIHFAVNSDSEFVPLPNNAPYNGIFEIEYWKDAVVQGRVFIAGKSDVIVAGAGLTGFSSILMGGDGGLSGLAFKTTGSGFQLMMYALDDVTMAWHGDLIPDTDNTYDIGAPGNRIKDLYLGGSINLAGGLTWSSGVGSPEGVVTAPIGSLYSNTSGGASTTLYVKTSGAGNTGWTAK